MFWIHLIIISVLTGGSNAVVSKPVVSVITTDILEGDTITLKCGYKEEGIIYVVWYYHFPKFGREKLYVFNEEYPSDSNSKNSWTNRSSGVAASDGFIVTLKNVTIQDSHPITCDIADNALATQNKESDPVSLVIAVEPSRGILQSNLTATANRTSIFECIVSRAKPPNTIDIAWFLEDQELFDIQKTEVKNTMDNNTYRVTSRMENTYLVADDRKKLFCVIKWTFANKADRKLISTDEGILDIQYPPFWTGHTNILYAEEATKIYLECLVKSNPPIKPSSTKWYVHGSSSIISTGEQHVLDKVLKSDFKTYRCEVIYAMQSKSFEIQLMEAGPPHITDIEVLYNKITSGTVPLKWVVGSDGGYPPQNFTIYVRKQGHRVFDDMVKDIEPIGLKGTTMRYDIKGLDPSTTYKFKVIAKNNRKQYFPEKPDTNLDEKIVTGTTKDIPQVTITEIDLQSDRLTVKWDYSSILEDLDQENYHVTIKIEYGKEFENTFTEYPKDNYIAVTSGSEVISGVFDTSSTYVVKLFIFENGEMIPQARYFNPGQEVSNDAGHPHWAITGFSVLSIVLIIVVVSSTILCLKHLKSRSKGQKGHNDNYLVEQSVYEDINVKSRPPKLPSRHSSQSRKDDLIFQNNNITAQKNETRLPSARDLGIAQYMPTSPEIEQHQILLRHASINGKIYPCMLTPPPQGEEEQSVVVLQSVYFTQKSLSARDSEGSQEMEPHHILLRQASKDELDRVMLTLPSLQEAGGEQDVVGETTEYLIASPSSPITVYRNNSIPAGVICGNLDNKTYVGDTYGPDTNTDSAYVPMGRSPSTLISR